MISAASTRNPWDSTHSRISHSDEAWGRFPTNSFDITSSVSFSRNAEHKKPEQTVVFGEFRTPPFLFSGCGGLCTRVGIAKKLPPQARRGGCAANKKLRSHLSPRRRVVKRTILLTSTTPAAATASAFPSSAEEGSVVVVTSRFPPPSRFEMYWPGAPAQMLHSSRKRTASVRDV